MDMYETEIALIKKYVKSLTRPNKSIRKKNFQQLSYSKWAANEVLSYVLKRPDVRPVKTVEYFAKKMDAYACKNGKAGYAFSVAYDISMDILDMLITKGERRK